MLRHFPRYCGGIVSKRTSYVSLLSSSSQLFRFQSLSTEADANADSTSNNNGIPFYGLPRPPPSTDSSDTSSSTSLFFSSRLITALKSASTAFHDPTRDDAVAALGEVTGSIALTHLLKQMQNHPTGRLLLQEKPIISKLTIPYEKLIREAEQINSDKEEITFGQAYGKFLLQHGFDPDERKPIRYIDKNDPNYNDISYIMIRYRQCHDYWHAVTGLPPTVLGELGLKWLELFQTGLPIAALSGTIGSLQLDYKEQSILWNFYVPWAIRCHKQQQSIDPNGSILTIYYEREFDTPLHVLQKRIGIESAPTIINNNDT